jgi:hypothetical protein
MSDEQVLSVWIGGSPSGLTTVQVVARSATGERTVSRRRGDEIAMREWVHELAARHDLVPIWDDASWMEDGSRRPPAPFYTTRELAPPTHMMLAG